MLKFLFVVSAIISTHAALAAATTPTGILLDAAWKVSLQEFAVKYVVHPSWGYSHSERNYHNTKMIAQAEHLTIDDDVLFASAFLHDVGGMPAFEKKGVDHGVRSAEVGIPLLAKWGFPKEKLPLVKEVIIGHIYYGPKPTSELARAFRDADMLDFLGVMGAARLIAATAELGASPAILNSVNAYQGMLKKLPAEFSFSASQKEGKKRVNEGLDFLKKLKTYSFDGKAY